MNTSQGGLVLLAVCMSLSFELVATLTKKKKKKEVPHFYPIMKISPSQGL